MVEKFSMVTIYTLEEWRTWLEKNHLNEKKVGLVTYKKHTGKPSISHKDAMHEAICFGWIDTIIKRIDGDRFVRFFVRRGDKANWSKNTLKYAQELLEAGRMAEAGITRYKEGLQKKPHDHDLPDDPVIPVELKNALLKNKNAKNNFEAFSPSVKKMIYRWILRAKGQETKERRIKIVVEKAKKNEKVFG